MPLPPDVQSNLNKLETQYGFVRANWGKLSAVVVGALIIGAIIGPRPTLLILDEAHHAHIL